MTYIILSWKKCYKLYNKLGQNSLIKIGLKPPNLPIKSCFYFLLFIVLGKECLWGIRLFIGFSSILIFIVAHLSDKRSWTLFPKLFINTHYKEELRGNDVKLNGPDFFFQQDLHWNLFFSTNREYTANTHTDIRKIQAQKWQKTTESIIIFPLHLPNSKITGCSLQSQHSCKMTQIPLATRWHFFHSFLNLFLKRKFVILKNQATGAMSWCCISWALGWGDTGGVEWITALLGDG